VRPLEASSAGQLVDTLVDQGLVTAAAALLQQGSEAPEIAYGGSRLLRGEAAVDRSTLFDLASLTKPLSATLALVLDQSGALPLATRIDAVWPQADSKIAAVSLEDLLRHRAGMRRWMPLYAVCRDRREVVETLLGGEWLDTSGEVYSDLGFILWALTTERALGGTYQALLEEFVLKDLGKSSFAFGRDEPPLAECALPTGREVELAAAVGFEVEELPPPRRGEVQDGNSRFLGGACGHAGVFATLAGMRALADAYRSPGLLLSTESITRATGGGGRYGLGWFRATETPAGGALGGAAFGHEGFAGSSLWLDPGRDRVAILLAHRSGLDVEMDSARVRLNQLMLAI
jgi:CubicO group peptidase (beta-lactamase class C family)